MSPFRQMARNMFESFAKTLGPEMKARLGRTHMARGLKTWVNQPSEPDLPSVSANPRASAPVLPTPLRYVPVELLGTRPSYRYKLEEMKRRRRLIVDELGVRDPLWTINDKYKAYDFADDHGIDHPKVYGLFGSIADVDWNMLPVAFVLKTRFGYSNNGVKALVKGEGDRYFDLLRSRMWTLTEIHEDQARKQSNKLVSGNLFAEELIVKADGAGIADDWKFYCFNGRVGLSMQRDLRGSGDQSEWRFKFRDRDWNDLGPIKFQDRLDESLPLPKHPDSLLETAEKLSALIGRPFIRVDLFESARGPLLGEFTPEPGPPEVFIAEIDEMLCSMWEFAEGELFAESIKSGTWEHLQY